MQTKSYAQALIAAQINRWNRLVTNRMRLVGETRTHMLFLHATKGYRRIHKHRLLLPVQAA